MYTLADVCTLITDGSHFSPEDEMTGYPMLSVKDMGEEDFIFENCKHVGEEAYRKLIANGCKPLINDVVLAKDGSYLKTAFPIKEEREIACLSSIAILRPNLQLVVPSYLSYYLKSESVYKTVSLNYISGTALKRIILKGIKKIPIALPDIAEQQCRVTLLDSTRRIINLRKEQLKQFDELIKARFVELFGDMADPMCKWDKCKLVDACSDPNDIKCGPFGTQLGKDEYTTSGVEVWEIPQINSEFRTMPTHFVTREKAMDLEQYSIKPGDIAMSRKGNVGRCAVFPKTFEEGIIHSDVLRIRVDNSRVAPVFMMRQLHYSGDIQHQIELVSSGAIMAGINVTKLKDIMVYIPPKELQDEFVSFVDQVDKSKVVVQKALEKTQLLFDSLMQEYFG